MEVIARELHSSNSPTTIPLANEDETRSSTMAEIGSDEANRDRTPERVISLPFCGSIYEPECEDGLQPKIGMVFDSWELGEDFYRAYAKHMGFEVRKWTQHKTIDGTPIWKRFVCSKEGWRKEQEGGEDEKPKRKVKITRCGCEAMIGFKIREDGKYVVAKFISSHTHDFVSPKRRHLIKSNREVTSDVKCALFTCHKAAIGTSAAFRILSAEKGGPANLGCTKKDVQNYERDCRKAISASDAQILIDIMKEKQSINPSFFFEYQLDEKLRLTHIFWADSTCIRNYKLFGDVMSFDSTYRTNRYDLVFTPFTGINHHKSCITFGAAFLPNEKKGSYRWLFRTFLKAMGGAAPKMIITDEDLSMKATIKDVFPNTVHRLCMWHILNKLPEKLGRDFTKDEEFMKRFGICVWCSETPDEFESNWASIITDYGLGNNVWLDDKYALRESWIPAYFVGYSLSGILRTTSRSESENAFFGRFVNRRLALLEFWIRFEAALEEQREKELHDDNTTLHTSPVLKTSWSIERHAREVYTHTIFEIFQQEVVSARDNCVVQGLEQAGETKITRIRDNRFRIREVQYNTCSKVVNCSCKSFESIGVLCSHIIVVLKAERYNEIPSNYVLHRWTKMATRKQVLDAKGNVIEGSCTSLPPAMKIMYSETNSKFNTGMLAAKHSEEIMKFLHKVVTEAVDHVLKMEPCSETSKVSEFEAFVGMPFPKTIDIHPPEVAHTKGNGKRFKRPSEPNQKKKRYKP